MAREKRNWHPKFIEYMKFIVKHPSYKNMPEPYKEDGAIRWVVSGNSELGKARAKWWDEKVKDMNLPNRAEVARFIHPKELKGLKPCQVCGKKLSIFYVYPNKNTLKRIERLTNLKFQLYFEEITHITKKIFQHSPDKAPEIIKHIFDIPENIKDDINSLLDYLLSECKTKLSPGVMSNPPDRFDGFHTYNACCRSKEDTGRHKSNLARYSQDRRAYENWAEGNWNLSNRLMGEFNKFTDYVTCPSCGKNRKMTADHIGPISLGFTHRPKFNPLCNSCNSAKNNRITYTDVQILIRDEKRGDKVISWHSEYLWNKIKFQIKNEEDALNLSKVMRLHLHNVLTLLFIIKNAGYSEFLKSFLNPEYSFYDYKFKNFHPLKLDEILVIKKPLSSKNKNKNAERYIRISLENLDEYSQKENRRVKLLDNKKIKNGITKLLNQLNQNKFSSAKITLNNLFEILSDEALKKFF